jgi:hypothetical protein
MKRKLRIESLMNDYIVDAELDVIKEISETEIIINTWGKNYKRLKRDKDEYGYYWKVIDDNVMWETNIYS